MQEMIEQIVRKIEDSCSPNGQHLIDWNSLKEKLSVILPSATIHPSQFVNGEPTEDGEYVVRVEKNGKTVYLLVYHLKGLPSPTAYTILSHCKLP